VLYRHLNVVIDPISPSRAAARFRGGSQG
jgi:hypothetical protein